MAHVTMDWDDGVVVSFDGPDLLGDVSIVDYCTEHGPAGFLTHGYTTPGAHGYFPQLTVVQFGRTMRGFWNYTILNDAPSFFVEASLTGPVEQTAPDSYAAAGAPVTVTLQGFAGEVG